MKKLIISALSKFIIGLALVTALIFLPAGTMAFTEGWIFIGVLFVPMLVMGIVLLIKDPSLLEKRLNSKEEESQQKAVVFISLVMFISGFIIAGLNHRLEWIKTPLWLTIVGSVLFLLSYLMYAEVLRENTYLSRTVEVQENQKVIDTGLYGVVRHPMYTSTIVMFLSIPLILGSPISFLIFLIYPFTLALRIGNEEKVLEEGLEGYAEYKKKVKYRLVPFIW